MPRNQRYVWPGYAYHVTQRGTNRQDVFRQVGDREVYLDLVRDQKQDAGVRIVIGFGGPAMVKRAPAPRPVRNG